MSLRKSFIKPRPPGPSLGDSTDKKQTSTSLAYGRKLSAKSIEPREGHSSFSIAGRRPQVPPAERKPSVKFDSFDLKRMPPKQTMHKPNESRNFGASSGSILQNPVSELAASLAQKKSNR